MKWKWQLDNPASAPTCRWNIENVPSLASSIRKLEIEPSPARFVLEPILGRQGWQWRVPTSYTRAVGLNEYPFDHHFGCLQAGMVIKRSRDCRISAACQELIGVRRRWQIARNSGDIAGSRAASVSRF